MSSTSSPTPLVSVQAVNAHIALMRTIHKLQEGIQLGDTTNKLPDTLNFYHRAVARFRAWLNTLDSSEAPASNQIPPLDVLMIWHCYLIQPVTYWSDSEQGAPILASMGGMPWSTLVSFSKQMNGKLTNDSLHSATMHQYRDSRVHTGGASNLSLGRIDFTSLCAWYHRRSSSDPS